MRRPPIACRRRAANPLTSVAPPHIWIPDDLLSLAVDRFFRADCPQQRRHGSHVPGPLEARRRSAKRRMTVQASMYPQGGIIPPIFNIGALFSYRGRVEPSWKYEPPSLIKSEQLGHASNITTPPPETSASPLISHTRSRATIPTSFLSSPETQPVVPTSSQTTQRVSSTHNDSNAGVVEVGVAARKISAPLIQDIKDCFDKFKQQLIPALQLPDDGRGKYLLRTFQECQPAADDAGQFTVWVLRYLLETQWAPNNIVLCLSKPNVCIPSIYTPDGQEFLRALDGMTLDSDRSIRRMSSIYKRIAEVVGDAPRSDCREHDTSLCLLIRGWWSNASQADLGDLWRGLGTKISSRLLRELLDPFLQDPHNAANHIIPLVNTCAAQSDLMCWGAEVLQHIPSRVLKRWMSRSVLPTAVTQFGNSSRDSLVFVTWLNMLHSLEGKAAQTPGSVSMSDVTLKNLTKIYMVRRRDKLSPHDLPSALLYALATHKSFSESSVDRISNLVTVMTAHQLTRKTSLNKFLAQVVSELGKASLPNHGVLELMIPLIHERKGVQSVLDLISRIQHHGSTLTSTTFLDEYLAHLIGRVRPGAFSAVGRQRQHHALALRICHELEQSQDILSTCGSAMEVAFKSMRADWQFQHIMARARSAHVVPLPYRHLAANLSCAKLSAESRTEFIHQLADQYSFNHSRTPQQNWRSIFYMYKYLRRNGLDIGPLFSKAVVRVCIIHPMSQNKFVSSRRLIWVCQLVASVEGEHVARKIEETFWVWRGDMKWYAQQTLVACGGSGRVHVNTMKRLGLI